MISSLEISTKMSSRDVSTKTESPSPYALMPNRSNMERQSSIVDLFIIFVIELVKGVEYHLQVVLDVRHLVAEVFDDFFFSHS